MNIHAPTVLLARPGRTLNMEFNAMTQLPFTGGRKHTANCYGYALHIEASVNPGFHGETRSLSEVASRKSFLKALDSDGLVPVARRTFDPSSEHIIAAYLDVRHDFHFARLDSTGLWSHKPGDNWDPIQTDFFGNDFGDPESVNLLTFDFMGYFSVPERMNPLTVCKSQKCDFSRNTNKLQNYFKALL